MDFFDPFFLLNQHVLNMYFSMVLRFLFSHE